MRYWEYLEDHVTLDPKQLEKLRANKPTTAFYELGLLEL